MVEIFKTNVTEKSLSANVIQALHGHLPTHRFNFDLDDPDNILRAENVTSLIQTETILQFVSAKGVIISLVTE